MEGDVWLKNARHANENARKLARGLTTTTGLKLAFPQEASGVFLHMPEALVSQLHERGWHFYKFIEPDIYRLMCSWSVAESDIARFIDDVRLCESARSIQMN